MIDYPNLPMMQPMSMGLGTAPKMQPNAMQGMGQKLLQAALAQNGKQPGAAPQPQVGQQMPGGAMNITPPAPQVGILQRLLGGFGGDSGGMAPQAMDSTNALY